MLQKEQQILRFFNRFTAHAPLAPLTSPHKTVHFEREFSGTKTKEDSA